MSDQNVDSERRALMLATAAAGGVAVAAAAVPFVASLNPSERAKAAGAPVVADIGRLAPGEKMVVKWRGKPVWILRRTPEMLASLEKLGEKELKDPASATSSQQKEYAQNTTRAIKEEYFVVVGICTHLGCSPSDKIKPGSEEGMASDWPGGFFCPCHGSKFDLAGRVFTGVVAPTNLEVPPYTYLSETSILIGEDPKEA
jgi:ubiquinol-cytochrome c reductase iron-sulfur subunit